MRGQVDGAVLRQKAARIAGALYLLTNVTAVFGSFVASSFVVEGDAGRTVVQAVAEGRLVRLGVASDLLTFAADVALVVALYVVVRPVSRHWAMLGAAWRLVETAIIVVCTLDELAAVRLAAGAAAQQPLALLAMDAHAAGYSVGLFFLGLGSAVFSALFYAGGLVPRGLAGYGVCASVLTAACTFGFVIFPEVEPRLEPWCFLPIFTFELAIGGWLMVRGVRPGKDASNLLTEE